MNNKLKVLLVSPYSKKGVGGIGTWTKIILDYCKNREDIELFFQNTATNLPKRSSLKNVLYHILIGSIDTVFIVYKLIRNLFLYKPDVVHYTSSAGFGLYKDVIVVYVVKKIFKKKFVIHWRFGRIPELKEKKNKEWSLLRFVIRRSSASIVIDEKSYESLISEGLSNVYLTPNPISSQLENISHRISDNYIQRENGCILFVGHILRSKGIVELIKATKDNPLVSKLIIVGPFFDVVFKEELQRLSMNTEKEDNWISWVGELEREAVFDYYKRCSLFCLPSYTEGFPNSVIEAMAFACPIVATKVGAIPEMLADECGELTDVGDVNKLKESINRVLGNQEMARKMGEKARYKVLENYTIKKVSMQYFEIWKK